MHVYTANRSKVELQLVPESVAPVKALTATPRGSRALADASPAVRAGRAFFELGREEGAQPSRRSAPATPPPAVFQEKDTGLLRMVYHEV
ncbi:MAG TPA: hypothetical protein VKE69_06370, partial [Planctomycetota bacterium]|nr:hypothetical protein [Planctomycetota bacterium]